MGALALKGLDLGGVAKASGLEQMAPIRNLRTS